MKKIIVLLMLSTGIAGNLCAQDKNAVTNTDKVFEPGPNSVTRKFMVDLGKGNKMQIELGDMENLHRLENIDSLLRVFIKDIQPLKDSLGNELLSKRIDYAIDSMGRKKIRLQQYQPKGTSYLVDRGDIAALKLEQDTIYISEILRGKTSRMLARQGFEQNYYRIGFFINQLSELPAYIDGRLNEKIKVVEKSENEKWSAQKDGDWRVKNGDPSVYAKQPAGFYAAAGDYLELKAGVSLQNYKNYFVPGVTISANVFIRTARFKHEIGFSWEPQFLFAKNSQGDLQTFRNDFIALTLGRERIKNNGADNLPHFDMFEHISIGYLIRQKGNIYDDHTFRVGLDAVSFKDGKIKLEPLLYFNNFFKNVTPGLRLSLGF